MQSCRDLEPDSGRNPDTIALDETVVKVNGERFWLYAAVEPETNVILHVSLYSTRTIVTTKLFLRDLAEKHEVDDAVFLAEFSKKRMSENLRCGRFQLCMKQSVRLWVDSGVQPVLLIVELDHGLVNRDVIR